MWDKNLIYWLRPGARRICEQENLAFSETKFMDILADKKVQESIYRDEYGLLVRRIKESMRASH